MQGRSQKVHLHLEWSMQDTNFNWAKKIQIEIWAEI